MIVDSLSGLELRPLMDIWTIYDYLVNTVHAYIVKHDECLYNALVLTFPNQNRDRLIRIRESARALITMIDETLMDRDADEENARY